VRIVNIVFLSLKGYILKYTRGNECKFCALWAHEKQQQRNISKPKTAGGKINLKNHTKTTEVWQKLYKH